VARGVVFRCGGAGQDELSGLLPSVDFVTHVVPERRLLLPLVDEARCSAFQEQAGIGGEEVRNAGITVHAKNALGHLEPCRRLPAGLDAFDQHRPGGPQPNGELVIDDARAVSHCLSLHDRLVPLTREIVDLKLVKM